MGFVRRVLALPVRTRLLGSAVLLGGALLASGIGQWSGIDPLVGAGFVLFPWGAGFLLMWLGDGFLARGRIVWYEEFHRSPVWLFLAFVGWSIAYVQFDAFASIVVLYELLVVGTALAATLGMVAVRTWSDRTAGPSGRLPSRRGTIVRLLPVALLFAWVYWSGRWSWTATVGLVLTIVVGLVAVVHPEWIPGVPPRVSEE